MFGCKFEFQTCSLWGMSWDEMFQGSHHCEGLFVSVKSTSAVVRYEHRTEQCSVSSIFYADNLVSYLQPVYDNYENSEY